MQEENSQKVKIFSRRLRGLRSNIGTQSELAAKLGLSLGTVGNWEAERNMPQGPLMRKLGEFFNVPVSFLMGEGPEHYPDGNGKQAGDVPGRAVLKQGANYYNAADGEDVGELSEDPEAFLVEMFGDAMEPKILAMDRLVVSPNAKVESGDLVMVKKLDDEIMVRVFIAGAKEGTFRLVAYNPIYGEQEWRREAFKFIYAITGVWRRTKVRGLYHAVKPPGDDEKDGRDGK